MISRLNYRNLLGIFLATYRLGVRHFVLQPVKSADLEAGVAKRLEITDDEYMPSLNDFLRRTEDSGARIKLYGMSQLGAYPSRAVEQEANVVKNLYGKAQRARLPVLDPTHGAETSIPSGTGPAPVSGRVHRISLRPANRPAIAFDCGEDQYILNAALANGANVSYGCRMGSCSSCCSKILEGRVHLGEQFVLDDEQTRQGYTLLCPAKPRSDLVIDADRELDLDP